MLEKIQIRGFGANEKLNVIFSSNVTTIVGKSFIGKSWMLRALRWVSLNRPAGDSYINWDSDKAKVRLSVDDKKVTRIRSKSINSYRLSGKVNPYVAFGNDVPRDIAELMNVSDKVNFQGQHTAPFWFCETAGEVSRQLNSIINLEVIDSTLSNIASELRKTRIVIEVAEKSLLVLTQEKNSLVYIEDLDIKLKQVESLQKTYQANVEKSLRIDDNLKSIAKHVVIRDNRLEQASDGLKTMHIAKGYEEIAASVDKLSKSIESIQNLQDILKNRPPSIRSLEKLKKEIEQINILNDRLDILIDTIENRRQEKCKAEKALESYKRELKEIAEGYCPLCGAKMKS